jgi:hypothetical protein
MPETMLEKRFRDVWCVGEINEDVVDKIITQLSDFSSRATSRVRLRFYNDRAGDISYIEHLRKILLHNTNLSIVVEEKPIDELPGDVKSLEDEAVLICSRRYYSVNVPSTDRLRIVEV